jgi:hypothetical protein
VTDAQVAAVFGPEVDTHHNRSAGGGLMALCDELITSALAKINSGWTCVPLEDGWLLITTSHQYSDGDHVELLVRRTNRSVEVSDGGEALTRLDLAGVSVERGHAREMWRRLLRAHGVELHHERLSMQGPLDDTGALVDNMANAVANIDGIRLLAPAPRSPRFDERLVTFFQAEFEHVEAHPQLRGRSGGTYHVTAAIGDPQQATFVQAVAGANNHTRQRAVEHAFTIFSDVNGTLPAHRKLVVLSDTDWRPEQTNLLSEVAYVGSWLYRDQILSFITSVRHPESHILMPVQSQISEGS